MGFFLLLGVKVIRVSEGGWISLELFHARIRTKEMLSIKKFISFEGFVSCWPLIVLTIKRPCFFSYCVLNGRNWPVVFQDGCLKCQQHKGKKKKKKRNISRHDSAALKRRRFLPCLNQKGEEEEEKGPDPTMSGRVLVVRCSPCRRRMTLVRRGGMQSGKRRRRRRRGEGKKVTHRPQNDPAIENVIQNTHTRERLWLSLYILSPADRHLFLWIKQQGSRETREPWTRSNRRFILRGNDLIKLYLMLWLPGNFSRPGCF